MLLGISKRGDTYVRSQLIHGDRSPARIAKQGTLGRIERDYRREVPACQQERPLLFLVSPLHDARITRALRRQWSQEWRWRSWRSLLLAYDRVLNPDHDDDAFRQFRRTLWDRAG